MSGNNMSGNLLFTPLQIGTITIKNRIGMSALTRNRAQDTYPTDVMKEYYVQRSDVPARAWPESPGSGPALGGSGFVKSRAGPKAGNQAWPGPALAQAGALLTN
ncbi:hypothetical protein BDZ97DRAFT_1755248 [Flammula alnicola]|nr:hypothetical protein BDZ97DRAFT_1755248 [Flammula alnicola]